MVKCIQAKTAILALFMVQFSGTPKKITITHTVKSGVGGNPVIGKSFI
jgi:hypothetical protein